MIGERGMWYKFNPFEGSVRVPMIAAGPEFKSGRVETALTSLADLLPTLVNIASKTDEYDFTTPIDGKSLFNLPGKGSKEDIVFFEYCSSRN